MPVIAGFAIHQAYRSAYQTDYFPSIAIFLFAE